ncbi:MAG: hypothetical protein HGB36_02995 [Chlorobiaceae bacterium]|nr:hypothetical protein [Chlorobiaceae bacterium]
MKSITLHDILFLSSGVFWSIVYLDAIRIGFRDRLCPFPLWALALNIAWELLQAILEYRDAGLVLQVPVSATWFLLDLFILASWFRFGKNDFPSTLPGSWFFPWTFLVLCSAFAIQYGFLREFGLYPGRAYAAFLQNLLMSLLFIGMLVKRNSGRGQSMLIAICKWLGTLCPTILFGTLGGTKETIAPNRFILVIGLLCSLFDIVYVVLLKRAIAHEQQPVRLQG